jgi:hypothetical protein
MTFVFQKAALALANGTFGDLDGIDLRVALLMTNTNAVAVRKTATFMSDITTLDEFDGIGYVRQVLASEALTHDSANDRIELTASANVWDDLPAGSDDIAGAVVYRHVGADSANPVLAWYDDGNFPLAATGLDFTVTWPAEGLLQIPCPLS